MVSSSLLSHFVHVPREMKMRWTDDLRRKVCWRDMPGMADDGRDGRQGRCSGGATRSSGSSLRIRDILSSSVVLAESQ